MNERTVIAAPAMRIGLSTRPAPVILHIFSTFAVGGPQRRFAALANHFGDQFHHIVIPTDGRTQAQALLRPTANCQVRLAGFQRRSMIGDMIAARRELRKIRPDLLVTYNWGAMDWATANLMGPVRHLHIEDGFGPEEAHRQLARRVVFRRLVLGWHTTLVLPSQNLMKLATNVWRMPPSHLRYVPNGIDCIRFQPIAAAPKMEFRGEGPVIGTAAALRPEKALDRLIEAFALVRAKMPARLVIVGDGPERTKLEGLAILRGLSDSISFTGNLKRPEEAVTAFDVFALSSDTEQMPLSVLEAMAAGLAIASTDVGDVSVMVAEENRRFIGPRTAEDLAHALGTLLEQPALARSVGAANRRRAVAEYDENRMFAAYESLFSGHAAA